MLLEEATLKLGELDACHLNAVTGSPENSFDHFVQVYGGYLPSSSAR